MARVIKRRQVYVPPADLIAYRRARAGLTQRESADLLRVSVDSFRRWETGRGAMKSQMWEMYRLKTRKYVKRCDRASLRGDDVVDANESEG